MASRSMSSRALRSPRESVSGSEWPPALSAGAWPVPLSASGQDAAKDATMDAAMAGEGAIRGQGGRGAGRDDDGGCAGGRRVPGRGRREVRAARNEGGNLRKLVRADLVAVGKND